MDLSNPVGDVIPSAHGAVLAVLARTTEPLSGRKVAALTDGRVKERRTSQVLGDLAVAGIVLCEHRPPVKLYRLNREHVAAPGIAALTGMWDLLLDRIRSAIASWTVKPVAACMFGSAARGDGGPQSDVDLLLLWDGDENAGSDDVWQSQIDQLASDVRRWSGNSCEVLTLTLAELQAAVDRDDRLTRDLRNDAINLAGRDVRSLLRRGVAR